MKKKLLIVTVNSNTKNGLKSYITSILGQYLDIDACLVKYATPEAMRKCDLVLFSADLTMESLRDIMDADIKYLISNRTFNHMYLNRIFMLPSGVKVYLVNDTKQSTIMVLEQLKALGLTQYDFVPYYPGCGEPDKNIQYAITLGELKLVPSHISTVIDIGNRVVDISTIIEIIVYFNLPMELVNEITRNYVNHILQIVKLTNIQLNEAVNSTMLTQSIVNNVSTGLCLIDENGLIKLVNQSFVNMLGLYGGHLVDADLNNYLQKIGINLNWKTQSNSSLFIKNLKKDIIKLTIQEIQDNKQKCQYLIHSDVVDVSEAREKNDVQYMQNKYTAKLTFKDYITADERTKKLIETAKRISLTDFTVLMIGEAGTGKSVLAQALHNNSSRSQYPFLSINIAASSNDILETELFGFEKKSEEIIIEEKPGLFELADKGTLYLENIHDLPYNLQCSLERIIEKKVVRRTGSSKDLDVDVRIIASTNKNLYTMVYNNLFRDDLFYNLNTVSLETIPLKNRKKDIPFLFNSSLKNAFNSTEATFERLFSENLKSFLLSYTWPGNVKEINNLCKYFSCVRTTDVLTMRDLPLYLQVYGKEKQDALSSAESLVLNIINKNPKIGRGKIQELLSTQGNDISEGKLRNIIQALSELELIKINRTRGGCEITEKGGLYINE